MFRVVPCMHACESNHVHVKWEMMPRTLRDSSDFTRQFLWNWILRAVSSILLCWLWIFLKNSNNNHRISADFKMFELPQQRTPSLRNSERPRITELATPTIKIGEYQRPTPVIKRRYVPHSCLKAKNLITLSSIHSKRTTKINALICVLELLK